MNNHYNDIIISASHDLRSQFHGILGISQILNEHLDTITKEDAKEYISMLDEGLKNNYFYFLNIFKLLRLHSEPERFKFAEHYINEIISDVISDNNQRLTAKKITLNVNEIPDISFICNKELLIDALSNILSNAVKYSYYNSEINFNIANIKDNIIFTVEDFGVGFKESHLAKLFDINKKFSTEGTLNESGSGLGLIMAYEISKFHSGRLEIKSLPERGTAVTLSVPPAQLDKRH